MRVISAPPQASIDSALEIVRLISDPARAESLLEELRAATSDYGQALAAIVGRDDALSQRETALKESEATAEVRTAQLAADRREVERAQGELAAGRSRYADELANLESQKQHAAQLVREAQQQAASAEALAVARSGELDTREKALAENEAALAARLQKLREI